MNRQLPFPPLQTLVTISTLFPLHSPPPAVSMSFSNIFNLQSSIFIHMFSRDIDIDGVDVPLSSSNENALTGTNNIVRRRAGFHGNVPSGTGKVEARGGGGGLKGLHFLNIKGKESEAWKPMEKRFHQYAVEDRFSRDDFGTCIGMGGRESKEFAGQLFDALCRRRKLCAADGITIVELRLFWEDLTSEDTESRLQIFFDM
ncbi:hypothetical protein ACLB2K_026850 [Fragaria x ananassa]